ncbi:MAG TPA: hypothetical protein VIK08_01090 [Candidatus Limnocylindrales bacterium]
MGERSRTRWTVRTLTVGTVAAVVFFVLAFVLGLADAGASSAANTMGVVALLVLLATPAAGLIVTSAELWHIERHAALLALVVLVILAAATAAALSGLH